LSLNDNAFSNDNLLKEMKMKKSLVLGLVALAAFVVGTSVGDEDRTKQNQKPNEVEKKVTALKIQRRDVLAQLVEVRQSRFEAGVVTMDQVIWASAELCEAQLELTQNANERIKLLRQLVDGLSKIEQIAKIKFEVARSPIDELLKARAARIAAEIRLVREQAS
jgi:hypothetical protein